MYGMYGIEDQKNSAPFDHPEYSISIVGKGPTHLLKQTDCIKTISHKLLKKIRITPDTYICLFSNDERREPLTRVEQVGKYYKLTGQGTKIRLYTQISFLLPECFSKLNADFKDYGYTPDSYGKFLPLVIKVYPNGNFTQHLEKSEEGTKFDVEGPKGRGLGI
jgi:hypothetical protein